MFSLDQGRERLSGRLRDLLAGGAEDLLSWLDSRDESQEFCGAYGDGAWLRATKMVSAAQGGR
jgi:hypothetical protein